jgi:hypothetical protein
MVVDSFNERSDDGGGVMGDGSEDRSAGGRRLAAALAGLLLRLGRMMTGTNRLQSWKTLNNLSRGFGLSFFATFSA